MPPDSRFAIQVLALRRRGLPVASIARELGRSEAEILAAHGMLGIAIADRDDEPKPRPTEAEREAMIERMPKKMADRIRRASHRADER